MMKGSMSTDLGIITVSPDVIAKYAGSVAIECFGIVGMAAVNVKDQLENSGVSVLGVVLNKVERKNQKGYYNKYYGSQKYEGYYGHNEETKNA